MRQLDVKSFGALVNQLTELTRKLRTGSALLGESGNPKFSQDIESVAKELFSALDPKLFFRANLFLNEGKTTVEKTFLKILRDKPELVKLGLSNLSTLKNHRIEMASRKLSLVDDLPEEEMANALEQGLSELDVQEVAEIINLTSILVNRIFSLKPELLHSLATQLVGSLDIDELKDATELFNSGVGEALKPLGRAVLPGLIKNFCEYFASEDDEYEDEVEEARVILKNFIMGDEVQS